MKTLPPSIYENLKNGVFYLDDLEEIWRLLEQVAATAAPALSTEVSAARPVQGTIGLPGYELESVDELALVPTKTFASIEMKVHGHAYVTFEVKPSGTRLYISPDSLAARGLVEEIKRVVRRCRTPLLRLAMMSTLARIPLVIAAILVAGWLGHYLVGFSYLVPLLIGGVAGVEAVAPFYRLQLYDSHVNLTRRAQRVSFWARNFEKIAVQVVISTITLLIGGIGGWLIKACASK